MVRPRGPRLLVTLVVPWAFVLMLASVYLGVMLPGALSGHALAVVGSVLVAAPLLSSLAAALTFTQDVMLGRIVVD